MHISQIIAAVVLAAIPVFALPIDETNTNLAERSPIFKITNSGKSYTCHPKNNKSSVKSFTVSQARAEEQAFQGGFTAGKSGGSDEPHHYRKYAKDVDTIQWGVGDCNAIAGQKGRKIELWEYPIYWNDKKKEWSKDALSQDKTPLRVVYYLDKNAPAGSSKRLKVCGVMTHSTVDANNEGKDSFQKC